MAAGLPAFYNDVKAGVYNGVLVFPTGGVAAKLYEVAPAYTETGFGAMSAGGISINRGRWDKMPPEVRAAFKIGCDEYESAYSKKQFARAVAALDTIKANKGSVSVMPDAERVRLAKSIENSSQAWIEAPLVVMPLNAPASFCAGSRRSRHRCRPAIARADPGSSGSRLESPDIPCQASRALRRSPDCAWRARRRQPG